MTRLQDRWQGFVVAFTTIAALLSTGTAASAQGKYAELTADWWQWVAKQPVATNPIFDETGAQAGNEQPEKKVFFLVGVINTSGTAERTITVPSGKAIFFPILNIESDNAAIPPTSYTVPQLRDLAAASIDSITSLFVTLDGVSLLDSVTRIKSPVFSYTLPDTDNIYQFFGLDITGTIKPAVGDGYWLYLPPLARGTYTLKFGGSQPGFDLAITYHITVK